MKKSRNLLILLIVLVLLGGVYAFVSLKPSNSSDPAADTQKIKLAVFDSKKIKDMTLKTGSGSLVLTRNGDNWVYKDNPNIKLDQTAANGIALSFANLYADKVVDESPSNLDEYGLKTPAGTAVASLDDGSTIEVNIGDTAPGADAYYAMMKGDPKLYIVYSGDCKNLMSSLIDIRDKNISSINTDTVTNIYLMNGAQTIELDKAPGVQQNTGASLWYLAKSKPYNNEYTVDSQTVQSIIDAIPGLQISSFVDDNPADYSKYGLDKPKRNIVIIGNQILNIYIGNDADSSSVYFKTADSKTVCTIDKSQLQVFDPKPFDLIDKYVTVPNIDDVDKIVIENSGKTDTLEIARTTKPATASGGTAETTAVYKVNGREVDGSKFMAFFNTLINIQYEAENDKKAAENPEVKITFTYNKGTAKEQTISYCPYNSDFYAAFKNDASDFLISKSQVQNALKGLEDLTK